MREQAISSAPHTARNRDISSRHTSISTNKEFDLRMTIPSAQSRFIKSPEYIERIKKLETDLIYQTESKLNTDQMYFVKCTSNKDL